MRPRIVAGNWKMNTTRETGKALAAAVAKGAPEGVEVVVCPPFPYLESVGATLAGSRVALGAQDCHWKASGAYTGAVSPAMLADVGCGFVIVGHSERRHGMGETEGAISHKVAAALGAGLRVILCVGETLEEREEGRMEQVCHRHVASGLAGLGADALAGAVIAYEPVWAIGTGKVATPAQAQEAHAFIRSRLRKEFGAGVADALPILYGGSVKGDNAGELFRQADIDGGLIGGASLKAEEFLRIAAAARR